MNEILPTWPLLSAFLIASFILAITPGPGVFYIVTRSLTQGRRAGIASVAGIALGNVGNVAAAALGLAALFSVSAIAFTVVKYAGAVYLIYLGIQALRSPSPNGPTTNIAPTTVERIFRDGFVVALLNPKTTLFFAAFLPQFMTSTAAPAQSIVLGLFFVAIAAVTDTMYALAAGAMTPLLAGARSACTVGRYLTASAYIGLGLFAALGEMRSIKQSHR